MQAARSTTGFSASRARPSGFTLTELMVVVALIGVMASFAVPSYRRAIEQSRVDIAGANLRAIWAAQRLYWLENQTYTTDLSLLKNMGVLDQSLLTANSTNSSQYWNNYFHYSVSAGTDGISTSFTANANVSTYTSSTSTLVIDQGGKISGNVKSGSITITPIDYW